ncbi:MAG TPA: aldo/keto reductase [Terriglobales bacterium]|nr:aldo/keto reductase [Terriglobales bacterium]
MDRRAFLASAAGACFAESLPAVKQYRRSGMIYRQLGQTDLYVSLLAFGSHTDPRYKVKVADHNILNPEGQQRRDRLISRALDLGVNMIDTYESEGQWEPVARVVRGRRDKTLISVCRQFPIFVGEDIDRAVKLYGHVDLYRIYVGGSDKLTDANLADWDMLRRAKEAGKVRAIGISTHSEPIMLDALRQLEGIDYLMFPYNFIHARADYSQFLPAAAKRGVGLIAIKPLAAGSIVKLDPGAKGNGTRPENAMVQLYQEKYRPLPPAVVAELTKTLDRLPGESLCQAALRFIYSRPFMTCAMPGMFEESTLTDNYAGLTRYLELSFDERAALNAAGQIAKATRRAWLPAHYRWLDERWHS